MSPRDKGAFARVLGELGRSIVAGELPVGPAGTIDELTAHVGASRSVVREVTRVLGTLGMMSAGQRVGLTVLPPERWDVLDPLVIRWRLDSAGRRVQIDEIRALRRAVEPAAAAAAARAMRDGAASLVDMEHAAVQMQEAAVATDALTFFRADRDFHAAVLAASGNMMFARLQAVIDESLHDRALRERADRDPEARDVELHVMVVSAVVRGDAEGARALMAEIIDRTGGDQHGGTAT